MHFDKLVDQIYEGAVVPERWINVLDQLAVIADAEGTLLFAAAPGYELCVNCQSRNPITPDLVIADYQLAHGQIGTKAIEEIRNSYGRGIPAVVLTGDTAPERHISAQQKSYVLLHKPIGPEHLRVILGSLLGM